MRILNVIVGLFILCNSYGQTNNEECKYFQVISYIRTNTEFNNQLKNYLPLDKKSKKEKFVQLNVSSCIQFIEFRQFKEKINADSVGINKDILFNDRLYYKTYYFDPIKFSLLESNVFKNDSKLYLTFSKVIGNTLLAEILDFDNHPNIIRRIGSGVKILFVFDQLGSIKFTLFSRIIYN